MILHVQLINLGKHSSKLYFAHYDSFYIYSKNINSIEGPLIIYLSKLVLYYLSYIVSLKLYQF